MVGQPKILIADIETRPALGYFWGLFNQNIGISQVIEPPTLLGVGYKWHDKNPIRWVGGNNATHEQMLTEVWSKLDDATHVVGWNSQRFDVPWLNQQFMIYGQGPPSPFKHVDLMRQVKKKARFLSNKLDWVAGQLLDQHKLSHEGFGLWVGCMQNDAKAWARMARYCKHDVRITGLLYDRLAPWLDGLNLNLYVADGESTFTCPNCRSSRLQKRGTYESAVSVFQKYYCIGCGKWSRSVRRDSGLELTGV